MSSLYTNIPHSEGKLATTQALSEIEDPDPRQPPPEVIGELIDIVLQNNVFEVNITSKNKALQWALKWPQPTLAYSWATWNLNSKIKKQTKSIYGNGSLTIYLSSGLGLRTSSLPSWRELIHSIKFTYECSENEITFLDITLYKGTRFHSDGILRR